MNLNQRDTIQTIEHEIVMLFRRADFKRTLDGREDSLDRSGYILLHGLLQMGPASIRSLAILFHLDISIVNRQVTSLQTKGFIERYVDEREGRVSLLFITEKGKESLLSAKQDRRNAYLKILSDLTIEETEIFAELLTRLNRKIEQRNKPR